MSDMQSIRPTETLDETDKAQLNFSNWGLVLQSCQDEELLNSFFEIIDDEALVVFQIDTAERGEVGYGILNPQRTGHPNWKIYSQEVRSNVKYKLESLIPERYLNRVAFAISIEETDAWLIPLFENPKNGDSASHINAKEKLRTIIGGLKKKSKYIDAHHNNLNYISLGTILYKNLDKARNGNESLNLFCLDVENLIQ